MSSLDKALDDVIKDNRKNNRQNGRSDQNQDENNLILDHLVEESENVQQVPETQEVVVVVDPLVLKSFGGRGNTNKQWTHDKFDDRDDGFGGRGRSTIASRLGGRLGGQGGGRQNDASEIKIDNLHYNVVEKDLQDLFELVGRVEKTRIIFDRSGRSTGSAHVKFTRRSDAEAAIEKYNNVELDGQAMSIQMAPERRGGGGSGGGRPQSSFGGGRGNRRGGGNTGRDRRNNNNNNDGGRKKRNEEDLDNEMDAYMKTSGNDGEDDTQMVID
ncbi:hypothetical protein BDC45DRAFT_577486 [Circinella umbellata]|nr:hypothetical protein BDC45DRAFT_577486 [Circinella umbellata]